MRGNALFLLLLGKVQIESRESVCSGGKLDLSDFLKDGQLNEMSAESVCIYDE